eukprot:CAMPEP_0175453310 /NCGR_PEP_ID=MMETSP0095-20121207/63878_1 /TAXON_ID=311494 /ORGANISM="Alexandrium monilatum, Strain CCMP3105" /LENGTH=57 /DNA_ID=CAMNT_0016753927 /DNA_START=46 /DNA_END=215 /DNA_ORIENTATION=+
MTARQATQTGRLHITPPTLPVSTLTEDGLEGADGICPSAQLNLCRAFLQGCIECHGV